SDGQRWLLAAATDSFKALQILGKQGQRPEPCAPSEQCVLQCNSPRGDLGANAILSFSSVCSWNSDRHRYYSLAPFGTSAVCCGSECSVRKRLKSFSDRTHPSANSPSAGPRGSRTLSATLVVSIVQTFQLPAVETGNSASRSPRPPISSISQVDHHG